MEDTDFDVKKYLQEFDDGIERINAEIASGVLTDAEVTEREHYRDRIIATKAEEVERLNNAVGG